MSYKDVPDKEDVQYSKSIAIGGLTGGIIGFVIAFLYKFSILSIPGFATIFVNVPIDPFITGIILGVVIGGVLGGLAAHSDTYEINIEPISEKVPYNADSSTKIKLREEQLKISKEKIQTGEVTIHKEVSTEEKKITVPVNREELVIEKTVFDPGTHNKSDAHTETIRIPISEERIDIQKHPVILEEVSVNRHQYDEIKHISETLKKEVSHIGTTGNAKVVDKRSHKK